MAIDSGLLAQFKRSVGDFSPTHDRDAYYGGLLSTAYADFSTDDISEETLNTTLGQAALCVYAGLLMDKTDIATSQALILLRNKLSTMTKGDRHV